MYKAKEILNCYLINVVILFHPQANRFQRNMSRIQIRIAKNARWDTTKSLDGQSEGERLQTNVRRFREMALFKAEL